jgi:acetyltransferase-like isoleucine patch superfamily enzyme
MLIKCYRLFAKLFILKKQPWLNKARSGLLFTNWFYQKVLKINNDAPFQVHFTSTLNGVKNLKINGNPETILRSFAVSGGCYYSISPNATLEIGEGTIWAFNVNLLTANHDITDYNKAVEKSVRIGNNCWIGSNVSILAGVELGDNVVVGANSVVTKSFPANKIIAGCPAKIIKEL